MAAFRLLVIAALLLISVPTKAQDTKPAMVEDGENEECDFRVTGAQYKGFNAKVEALCDKVDALSSGKSFYKTVIKIAIGI